MMGRGRRPSSRTALVGLAALVGSSGCLALLEIDDGHFVHSDGGISGGDDDDDDDGGARHDGSVGGGGDGATFDGGDAEGGSFSPEDVCDTAGWHRDCTFGDGGFVGLGAAVRGTAVATSDPAGNVYIVASLPTTTSYDPPSNLVTLASDGGVTMSTLSGFAPIVDVRVLDDGELAILGTDPFEVVAQVGLVDAGMVAEAVTTAGIPASPFSFLYVGPLRLLQVGGTSWTAACISIGEQNPVIVSFDFTAKVATPLANGPVSFVPTTATGLDSGTWFIGGNGAVDAGQPFETLPPDGGGGVSTMGLCAPPPGTTAFGGLVAVDDRPLGVVPQASGFAARVVTSDGTCPVLASYAGSAYGQPDTLGTARGAVSGLDSVVVIGHESQLPTDMLLVAHLPISAGAKDASAPFTLRVADGVASRIALGANATLGTPVLVGTYLYVPFVADAPSVDAGADGGTDGSADAGRLLSVVRLVYRAP